MVAAMHGNSLSDMAASPVKKMKTGGKGKHWELEDMRIEAADDGSGVIVRCRFRREGGPQEPHDYKDRVKVFTDLGKAAKFVEKAFAPRVNDSEEY